MLTLQALKEMQPGEIIATGLSNDDPQGLFMTNTNRQLRWVTVRGYIADWAIYCHFAEKSITWIVDHGDKVGKESNIKMCVPCDDEAFKAYRY